MDSVKVQCSAVMSGTVGRELEVDVSRVEAPCAHFASSRKAEPKSDSGHSLEIKYLRVPTFIFYAKLPPVLIEPLSGMWWTRDMSLPTV